MADRVRVNIVQRKSFNAEYDPDANRASVDARP
jgi:hypothetical protein